MRSNLRLFIIPYRLFLLMVLQNSCRNRDSFFDKLVDFKIVNNQFFIDSFVLFKKDKQNFMENTQHFSQFFYLLISFLNIASEKQWDGMNTFCTYLKGISLPPKKKKIQKVCTYIILVNSVMVNHSTKTFNRKNSDIWIFVKNEMGNFLHECIRIVISCFLGTCIVHYCLRV